MRGARALAAAAAVWLSACSLTAPADIPASGAAAADVAVTTLPDTPAGTGQTTVEKGKTGAADADPDPAPAPAETPPPPPAAEVAPPAPAVPQSPEARTCTRRGGTWTVLPGSGLGLCQTPTRDGLRACRRATDCQGDCLARSGTCAPATPLLGCNEVLDDFGRRVRQCLE